MGIFQQFPYSNFHEYNLDELIKIVKQLADDWAAYQTKWSKLYTDTEQALIDFKNYVEEYWETLDITEEIRTLIEQHAFDSVILQELSPVVTDWLDENITIPEGVVIDRSLSIEGACADAKAVGNAVTSINDSLNTLATIGVANYRFQGNTQTLNGVHYEWNGDTCEVSGTASSNSANSIWAAATPLPEWIVAGNDYDFIIDSSNAAVKFGFVFGNGNGYTYKYIDSSQKVHIPSDTVTLGVRLYVNSGAVISPTATIKVGCVYDPEIKQDAEYLKYFVDNADNVNLLDGVTDDKVFTHINDLTASKSASDTFDIHADLLNGQTGTCNLYYNRTKLPIGFVPGETYNIYAKSDKVRIAIISYISADDNGTTIFYKNQNTTLPIAATFTLPSNATGITFRFTYYTDADIEFTDTAVVRISKANVFKNNKKMKTIGNSFTGGAVWNNDAFDHFADVYDTVPANIGTALGVDVFNNVNRVYSSAGILYDAGQGNFNTLLTQSTSIDGFDYIMTLFSGTDIDNYSLGNINSAANDGTLAGAIRNIAEWVHSTNDKCTLILLSVPPYSSTAGHTGPTVFSGNWSQGYSIADLDELMYKMSKKYHFIYISWQDLSMSYHYMDYADYAPGYTGSRHANDDSVYRALGIYAGRQAQAINSPIALSYIL